MMIFVGQLFSKAPCPRLEELRNASMPEDEYRYVKDKYGVSIFLSFTQQPPITDFSLFYVFPGFWTDSQCCVLHVFQEFLAFIHEAAGFNWTMTPVKPFGLAIDMRDTLFIEVHD